MNVPELPTSEEKLPRGGLNFAFILSMPSNNSWNGRWSGEERMYARVKTFTSREWKERLCKLIGNHSYNFGDGWRANVEVKLIDKETKRKLIKQSAGFCGYDWMIDSLVQHGDIRS